MTNVVHFVNDNHLDESTSGNGLKDGAPRVACGQLRANEQVDHYVIGLLAIRVEGHQAFDKQTLVLMFVLIPMISFHVVLCGCRTLHLVRG